VNIVDIVSINIEIIDLAKLKSVAYEKYFLKVHIIFLKRKWYKSTLKNKIIYKKSSQNKRPKDIKYFKSLSFFCI